MGEAWFYEEGGTRRGPVDGQALRRLVSEGRLSREATVWKEGVQAGVPAGLALDLMQQAEASAAVASAAQKTKSFLGSLGSKLSEVASLPEIGDVPVGSMLTGGDDAAAPRHVEDIFAVGTSTTTPALADIAPGWPRPRVWWKILIGAVATYLLLRIGITEFNNPRFFPGLVVIGSFVVPLSVVVLFFEMNTPRNVSVYQVAKMTLFGGTLSLLVTMVLFNVIPGSGVGEILKSLITGVIEESGKALALLIVLKNTRWRWQLNGLRFGAAVGAGFAGFESAGYAWESEGVFGNLLWRGLLSPGGHVIWTAMIGAALWQVRGDKPFDWNMFLHPVVVRRWIIAVVLHGLWDTHLLDAPLMQYVILLIIGWYIVFAVLKQAIAEVAAARSGATA